MIMTVNVAGIGATAAHREFLAELGFAGFDVSEWFGIVAPAKTPPAIVARLNAETNAVLADPEWAAKLADGRLSDIRLHDKSADATLY